MKGQSFLFSATRQWLVGDVPFNLKWAIEVTHPLQKSLTSTDFRVTNAILPVCDSKLSKRRTVSLL